MKFSQRIGVTPPQKIMQLESIDEELRNGLWNALTILYWNSYKAPASGSWERSDYVNGSNLQPLVHKLWVSYFKKPIDTIDKYWEYCYAYLRTFFYRAKWYEIYEFVEFIAEHGDASRRQSFIDACNLQFSQENSAYRFVDGKIAEITSSEEIAAIETAIAEATPYGGVKAHLKRAIVMLSDKKALIIEIQLRSLFQLSSHLQSKSRGRTTQLLV